MIRNILNKSLLLEVPLTSTLKGVTLKRFYGEYFRLFCFR